MPSLRTTQAPGIAAAPVTVGRKPSTPWKIGVGVLLLIAAAANGSRSPSGGAAGALGALAGLCVLVLGGIALIASGLPKTLGSPEFAKRRRRLWLKHMGIGFLLMVACAFALSYMGFAGAALLAIWLYWFMWSWVAWRIADRTAALDARLV